MPCMDDQNFDDETGLQWIRMIEASASSLRDRDIYPMVAAWLQAVPGREILELGCGQGVCSEKVDFTRFSYTGLEASPVMVARAAELYECERRAFVQGNAYALPFSNHHFEGVFSVLVWHLLRDLKTAASELRRVLKTGGHFLILTANPEASPAWKGFYESYTLEGKRLEGVMKFSDHSTSADVLYLHTHEELVASLQAASLDVRHVETFRPSSEGGTDLLIALSGTALPRMDGT